jgi:hypothetical protein
MDDHESINKYSFNLSKKYFFIVTLTEVLYFNLFNVENKLKVRNVFSTEKFKKLGISINKNRKNKSEIIGCHCSSDPEKIALIVNTTFSNEVLYMWDMQINAEIDSIDVGKKYEIIFDSTGDIIVANDKNCIYNGTNLLVFDIHEESI